VVRGLVDSLQRRVDRLTQAISPSNGSSLVACTPQSLPSASPSDGGDGGGQGSTLEEGHEQPLYPLGAEEGSNHRQVPGREKTSVGDFFSLHFPTTFGRPMHGCV